MTETDSNSLAGAVALTRSPWAQLHQRATAALEAAQAPYSHLRMGAALLDADGTIHVGCSIESAARFGIHAESGAVSSWALAGAAPLTHLLVIGVNDNAPADEDNVSRIILPCGACRQILHEIGGDHVAVLTENGEIELGDLLPHAFGGDQLR